MHGFLLKRDIGRMNFRYKVLQVFEKHRLCVLYVCINMLSSVFNLVCSILSSVVNFCHELLYGSKFLPPGPPGLPVIGNLRMLEPNPAIQLQEWSKQYGPTVSVRYGSELRVVLHDYDTAKRVFHDDRLNGRDPNFIMSKLLNRNGVQWAEEESWRVHRRFTQDVLRRMGKNYLEDIIMVEVENLLEVLARENGAQVNPAPFLHSTVLNILLAAVFGDSLEVSPERAARLGIAMDAMFANLPTAVDAQFLPWLKYLPGKVKVAIHAITKCTNEIGDFVQELRIQCGLEHLDVHQLEGRKNFTPRRMSSARLSSARRTSLTRKNFVQKYCDLAQTDESETMSEENLLATMHNIIVPVGTTVMQLVFAFYYATRHPEAFRKVQAEIRELVGSARHVTMPDRGSLPYTTAFIYEVQRLSSLVPLSLWRRTMEPVVIDGYTIPENTCVAINTYAMHRDPRFWKYPNEFRPENFLLDDGTLHMPKGFAPVGMGKRLCLGDPILTAELHLIFANLAQRFDFASAVDQETPAEKLTDGVSQAIEGFQMRFVEKN